MYSMTIDPGVQTALITGISAIGVAFVGVVVAMVNSRKERGVAAENAMIATLKERLTLRDEQLEIKDHIIEKLKEEIRLHENGRME